MITKVVLLVLCAVVLVVLYRTEAVLKKVFRIEEPSQALIMKTKYILLVVASFMFIAAILLNK